MYVNCSLFGEKCSHEALKSVLHLLRSAHRINLNLGGGRCETIIMQDVFVESGCLVDVCTGM